MNTKKLLLLSVLSGLMLSPAWYAWGHGLFLAFALVPLLAAEDYLDQNKDRYGSGSFFRYSFLAFMIWNTATTWWIVNATAVGVIAAVFINSFMWSATAWCFHVVKRKLGIIFGYFSLILFWISWEYIYHNSEISWPWLALGNGFAYNIKLVQWYEYTGVLGGSLWMLVINILIFNLIKSYSAGISRSRILAQITIILVLTGGPIAFSLLRYYTYTEQVAPKTIVVIQPNIDPYEKFVSIPSLDQTLVQLTEAAKVADSTVDYFISPETSINNNIWMDQIDSVPDIRMIRAFLHSYPKAAYIPGIQCYKRYLPGEKLSENAREIPGTGLYYESFNAAIQLDSTLKVPFYFKSKLVVGVEKMPYARYLRFLEKLTVRLGGAMRGWGTQKERGVFFSSTDSTGVGPIICYESVYGEFVTGYVKNGANLLFVITNDGWWGDTPGYHQHASFSSLRAIETRRSIARSANTGISCLINQRGDILQELGWWKRGVLKGTLNASHALTYYVRNGDYIGRVACFFSIIVLAATLLQAVVNRYKKQV
jgi:apolipoprotein N-acyltransferase